eukprot:5257605-Amphidinium_carterae.1
MDIRNFISKATTGKGAEQNRIQNRAALAAQPCDTALMHPIKVGLCKHTAMHLAGFIKSDPHREMKVALRPLMVGWVNAVLKDIKQQTCIWTRAWYTIMTHNHADNYESYCRVEVLDGRGELFVHKGEAGALEERPKREDTRDGDVEEVEHAQLFAKQQPSLLEEEDEFEQEAHEAVASSTSSEIKAKVPISAVTVAKHMTKLEAVRLWVRATLTYNSARVENNRNVRTGSVFWIIT